MIRTLGMLSFASPLWAWGAVAAVGVPLLAHLLSRARYREVLFPATRLVRQAVVATTRIERPRHLLLLLLRLLALMAIVAAFMQPRWVPEAEAIDPERGVSLVVLLDASASMQRVDAGATLYRRGVREAAALITGLDPTRDVASVVRVEGSATPLLPEPTAQLDALAARVEGTSAGFERADWSSALAEAGRLARQGDRQVRIVVISDQQGDWPSDRLDRGPLRDARVDHVRLDGPADNSAVRLLDLRPYPPIAGRPITARVELSHFGPRPREVALRASMGPDTLERAFTLAPGSTQQAELVLPAPRAGTTLLRIAIDGGDAMAWDNQSGVVLEVQAAPRVLVVVDEPGRRAAAERIGLMLRPGDDVVSKVALPRIEYATPTQALEAVEQADASELRTVVAFASEAMGDGLYEAMKAYAQRGGGVVLFGERGDALSASLRRAGNLDFSIEPLRVFEGPARAGLAALAWPGGGAFEGSRTEADANTLLSDRDGEALVSEKTLGRGRMLWLHTTIDARPGGLPAEPAFVVLFNELVRYASPGPSMPAPPRPGDALPQSLRDAARLSLPEGAKADAERITAPGAYLALDGSGQLAAGIVAQLAPEESNTRPGDPWPAYTGSAQSGDASASADLSAGIRPEPIELWPYLVFATVLLAAAESSLLWRFAGKGGAST